jgi:hypothetical protein
MHSYAFILALGSLTAVISKIKSMASAFLQFASPVSEIFLNRHYFSS